MNLENLDIRNLAAENNIAFRKIAKRIGISPEYLSRCMRKPLIPLMRSKILKAIDDEKKNAFLASASGYEVEYCNVCEREIELRWDINRDGFQAICPVCGNRLMLCDACQHRKEDVSEYNAVMGCVTQGDCDYCTETDSCRFSRPKDWWKTE